MQSDQCHFKKIRLGHTERDIRDTNAQNKSHVRSHKVTIHLQAKENDLKRNSAGTLISK
jgi:hypothetical protein